MFCPVMARVSWGFLSYQVENWLTKETGITGRNRCLLGRTAKPTDLGPPKDWIGLGLGLAPGDWLIVVLQQC